MKKSILVTLLYLIIMIVGIFIIIFNFDRNERLMLILILGGILMILQRLTLHFIKTK